MRERKRENPKSKVRWLKVLFLCSNAGSAALIVLLLLVGCGIYVLMRLRRSSRLQRGSLGLGAVDDAGEHELDRFIGREDRDEEETYSDETYRQSSSQIVPNGNANRQRREFAQGDIAAHEEIFDVGNESDEEEEEGLPPRQETLGN